MCDENVENAAEGVEVYDTKVSIIRTSSSESGPAQATNDIDDQKTPLVFGRLWRELVSVFTLAFSPGLNVYFLIFSVSDVIGYECGEYKYCVTVDWERFVD